MKFIELRLGSHQILHGFDNNNKEILETVNVDGFIDKLVAVNRIKSVSENAILIDYGFDRLVYWQYDGTLKDIKAILV